MKGSEKATIESSLRECDSHLSKCRRALGLLEPLFPLSMDSFGVLEEEHIGYIDQLIYRFTKLQDSMGTRLLPSLYSFVENDARPQPFLTILSRLEQLSVLTSTEDWQFFRNLRNNLAHDYPESVEQTVETLNTLHSEFDSFAGMYLQVREFWFSQFFGEWAGEE